MDYRWTGNPFSTKRYSYPCKDSITPTKTKAYLVKSSRSYDFTIRTEPFYINIYNKKEAMEWDKSGELFIKNPELNIGISVIIVD